MIAPTGRLTKNTARQPLWTPNSAISAPPSSGPIAVEMPTTVPKKPNALPRSSPWNIVWISPLTCGVMRPPAKPCTTRAMISTIGVGAAPQPALASANTATPVMNTVRRPRASPSRPDGTSSNPSASA